MMPRAEAAYSENALALIAANHRIPELSMAEAAKILKTAGAVYLDMKTRTQSAALSKDRAPDFFRIEKGARKLRSDIEALDGPSTEQFWQPIEFAPRILPPTPRNTAPLGRTARVIEMAYDVKAVHYLKKDDVLEALSILENFARLAGKSIPRGPRGPRPNYALVLWVGNMRRLWQIVLRRRFTFSVENNVPKSKAFQFCIEAMSYLDPAVEVCEMIAAVRAEKKDARRYRGSTTGNNSP
jgi:hypothetical protein